MALAGRLGEQQAAGRVRAQLQLTDGLGEVLLGALVDEAGVEAGVVMDMGIDQHRAAHAGRCLGGVGRAPGLPHRIACCVVGERWHAWSLGRLGSIVGGCAADDPFDRVVAPAPPVSEDDDLADQADGDDLDTQHDHQDGQDERGAIGQRHGEHQLGTDDHQGREHAERENADADWAEEPQRPLGELEQQEQR